MISLPFQVFFLVLVVKRNVNHKTGAIRWNVYKTNAC